MTTKVSMSTTQGGSVSSHGCLALPVTMALDDPSSDECEPLLSSETRLRPPLGPISGAAKTHESACMPNKVPELESSRNMDSDKWAEITDQSWLDCTPHIWKDSNCSRTFKVVNSQERRTR